MANMSESFPPDALFGVDGTQMPEPLPDPLGGSGRGTSGDTAQLPPFVLPPLPDASAIREAIDAVLGDDPTEPVDQDDAAAPASQPAGQSDAPNIGAVPQAVAPAEAGNRPAPHRSPVVAPVPPTPSSPQRPPRWRNLPPTPAQPRAPMPPADLRRRIRRQHIGLPLPTRSDGGATAALIILLILMAVLIYYIITGFLQSISNFLQ
jgi:hypothetical protein